MFDAKAYIPVAVHDGKSIKYCILRTPADEEWRDLLEGDRFRASQGRARHDRGGAERKERRYAECFKRIRIDLDGDVFSERAAAAAVNGLVPKLRKLPQKRKRNGIARLRSSQFRVAGLLRWQR